MGMTTLGLPYPEDDDTPDIPRDIKALAEAVDPKITEALHRGSARGTVGSFNISAGGTVHITTLSLTGQAEGVELTGNQFLHPTLWGWWLVGVRLTGFNTSATRSFINISDNVTITNRSAVGPGDDTGSCGALMYMQSPSMANFATYSSHQATLSGTFVMKYMGA
jgi:hypothetical protein